MGAKGPVFIMLMGVAAIASFALMGKFVIDEVPTAQALIDYRQSLAGRFRPDMVEIRGNKLDYTVRLYGDELPAMAPGPELLKELAGEFRTIYKPSRIPESLEVIRMTPGAACRGPEELWRVRYDFAGELARFNESLTTQLGKSCRIRVLKPDSVRLESVKSLGPADLEKAAGLLCRLWGGGWQMIQIRHGGRVVNFDAEGKPLR